MLLKFSFYSRGLCNPENDECINNLFNTLTLQCGWIAEVSEMSLVYLAKLERKAFSDILPGKVRVVLVKSRPMYQWGTSSCY